MLDFHDPAIQALIEGKGWKALAIKERLLSIYNYVRDEIKFGYNKADDIPASQVLLDGYGQCNTKSILLMALLRALDIPCRIHGFTIDKALQKGAMTSFVYGLSPASILHSWVEVLYIGRWLDLEGVILDKPYIESLQRRFPDCPKEFCGYGVATKDLSCPKIEWNEDSTYIQKEGINSDLGLFDAPDDLFSQYRQKLNPIKRLAFETIGRSMMNNNIRKIRDN